MKIPMRPRTSKTLIHALFAALAACSVTLPHAAFADAPAKQATQSPGYYRMALGEFEVTALYDGVIPIDAKLLKGAAAKDIQSLLARMFVPASEKGVQTAINAFLINTGRNLILVDAGAAGCFGPGLGAVAGNIRAAGYEPAQVDTILLTHLHGDHVCGIAAEDGKPAFANATVYVSREEAGFWLNKETAAKAPKEAQPFFKAAQDSVAPYVAAGKLKEFSAGQSLVPGVESVPLHGHTPGHGGYLFSSAGQRILVWGDVVHSHAVQFTRPEVSIEFDTDSKQAIASRKKILADASADKLWIAGAHLPFPGIGHVGKAGKSYAWVPVEYSPLPSKQ
jgi:glyoxylase-like metal-dependent hydrolase (beta-lactamase superfamily II)